MSSAGYTHTHTQRERERESERERERERERKREREVGKDRKRKHRQTNWLQQSIKIRYMCINFNIFFTNLLSYIHTFTRTFPFI